MATIGGNRRSSLSRPRIEQADARLRRGAVVSFAYGIACYVAFVLLVLYAVGVAGLFAIATG